MVEQSWYPVVEPPASGEVESKAIMALMSAEKILELAIESSHPEASPAGALSQAEIPTTRSAVAFRIWQVVLHEGGGSTIIGRGIEDTADAGTGYVVSVHPDSSVPASVNITRP